MIKEHIRVHSDINATEYLLSWFEQINQPTIEDKTLWWQCQTLLVEGFINIVEHAHKGLPQDTPIDLEVIRFCKHVEIRIWSYGQAFNIEEKTQETEKLEDNFNERGRGLQIMSTIADRLSYLPQDDNRYCLFISKSI